MSPPLALLMVPCLTPCSQGWRKSEGGQDLAQAQVDRLEQRDGLCVDLEPPPEEDRRDDRAGRRVRLRLSCALRPKGGAGAGELHPPKDNARRERAGAGEPAERDASASPPVCEEHDRVRLPAVVGLVILTLTLRIRFRI